MPATEERLAKLPAWAREEIARLSMDVHYLTQQLNPPHDSPVSIRRLGGSGTPLPEGARVVFSIGLGDEIEVYRHDGYVALSALTGELAIRPRAANMAYAMVVDR
jgi:hypothetical protein